MPACPVAHTAMAVLQNINLSASWAGLLPGHATTLPWQHSTEKNKQKVDRTPRNLLGQAGFNKWVWTILVLIKQLGETNHFPFNFHSHILHWALQLLIKVSLPNTNWAMGMCSVQKLLPLCVDKMLLGRLHTKLRSPTAWQYIERGGIATTLNDCPSNSQSEQAGWSRREGNCMQQIQIGFQAIANVLETREKWLQVCFHSSIGIKVKQSQMEGDWHQELPKPVAFVSIFLPLALQVVLCSFSAR